MAKKFIQEAIKHPGALHRDLGVPQGQKIPAKKLAAAANSSNPTIQKRAQFAQELKGFQRPGYADGGKLVKVHFCEGGKTGYADGGKVATPPPPKPTPEMLGTGLAAKAGEALKKRKSKLDEAIEASGG